jgi:hypothetical protein
MRVCDGAGVKVGHLLSRDYARDTGGLAPAYGSGPGLTPTCACMTLALSQISSLQRHYCQQSYAYISQLLDYSRNPIIGNSLYTIRLQNPTGYLLFK